MCAMCVCLPAYKLLKVASIQWTTIRKNERNTHEMYELQIHWNDLVSRYNIMILNSHVLCILEPLRVFDPNSNEMKKKDI